MPRVILFWSLVTRHQVSKPNHMNLEEITNTHLENEQQGITMQCPVVLVPNGSKPLCNFLVHISSFLPGASALAPVPGLGKKGPLHQKTRPRRPGFKGHPIEFMKMLNPYLGPVWTHLNSFGPIET